MLDIDGYRITQKERKTHSRVTGWPISSAYSFPVSGNIASENSADQFLKNIARKKAISISSAILAKKGNLNLDLNLHLNRGPTTKWSGRQKRKNNPNEDSGRIAVIPPSARAVRKGVTRNRTVRTRDGVGASREKRTQYFGCELTLRLLGLESSFGDKPDQFLLLRGTIVDRTCGPHKNLPGTYLPIFTKNIWSYLPRMVPRNSLSPKQNCSPKRVDARITTYCCIPGT